MTIAFDCSGSSIGDHTREIPDWVDTYSKWTFLTKPEEIVIDRFRDRWKDMKMLDIGVGGGRTTPHFAWRVDEYVAIDYDEHMLEACRMKFPHADPHMSFMRGDARAMSMFGDGRFDFILFSFQGLDYLSHHGRQQALREIKRVGKEGGYFFFSSHNLNVVDNLFALEYHDDGLRRQLNRLWNHVVLRLRNEPPRRLRAKPYAIVYDGVYNARLTWLWLSFRRRLGYYYYIKPTAQVRQLEEAGFNIVAIYGLDGREISGSTALSTVKDPHVHYLCQIPTST